MFMLEWFATISSEFLTEALTHVCHDHAVMQFLSEFRTGALTHVRHAISHLWPADSSGGVSAGGGLVGRGGGVSPVGACSPDVLLVIER